MIQSSVLYKTLGYFSENVWSQFSRTTHHFLSRLYSWIYEKKISRYFIKPYCWWQYGDSKHHLKFKPGSGKVSYECFQDFFTRDFFEHPLPSEAQVWPCEGLLCDSEPLISQKKVQVKQDQICIRQIFGSSAAQIPPQYFFTNIFLHNKNYHHIHSPVTGKITHIERIPGALLWLRPQAYPGKPSLPALTNERVNLRICDTQQRVWYLSIVGGPAVASIKMDENFQEGSKVRVGEKVASFALGSTCCMASPEKPSASIGEWVAVGQKL